jgi:mannose-1-phosphate guanylyltransferase
MQALVLVGGEGTRLRPLTLTQPKPAITLVDRPFIRFMVDWLARHGVDDVIMACGFRAELLRERLGEGGGDGPRIRYLEEPEALGTAGPIRFAGDQLDDRFLALNGDVLTDLDLTALIRRHEERGALGTLALYPVRDVTGYGLVRRREGGEITEFLEKPDLGEVDTNEINAGAYVLERSVIDLIPPGRAVSIEREIFPRLVGQGLYGLRLEGYWMDIGTPERYLQASWDILERTVDTDLGSRLDRDAPLVADGVRVDERALLQAPALIAAGVEIEAGAQVGPRAVVGRDTVVAGDASITGSVLLSGCEVGHGAQVAGSIVGGGVEIGAGAEIAAGAVIGEGARVAPATRLEAGARIDPAEHHAMG